MDITARGSQCFGALGVGSTLALCMTMLCCCWRGSRQSRPRAQATAQEGAHAWRLSPPASGQSCSAESVFGIQEFSRWLPTSCLASVILTFEAGVRVAVTPLGKHAAQQDKAGAQKRIRAVQHCRPVCNSSLGVGGGGGLAFRLAARTVHTWVLAHVNTQSLCNWRHRTPLPSQPSCRGSRMAAS